MPTGLDHISDGQLPDGAFTTTCHTWTVGPLSIQGCIDATALTISGDVSLLGVRLDHFVLDEREATTTIGGSVAGLRQRQP